MLYIVSTPIGHLDDISKRALATLESCNLIFCEDTRRSSILLNRYEIKTRLVPYHKFNEKQQIGLILEKLAEGQNVALISDAGTPCINDPGLILVQGCIENKVPFTAIPGACSPIQALILSGMDTSRFQYIGFLPKNPRKTLREALCYLGTTIALESPERIVNTLEEIQQIDPQRKLAVLREMTKAFEECLRGTPDQILERFKAHPPRGEIVLTVEGGGNPSEDTPLEELIEMLKELHGLSLKEAIKLAARLKKVPKRSVYQHIHNS